TANAEVLSAGRCIHHEPGSGEVPGNRPSRGPALAGARSATITEGDAWGPLWCVGQAAAVDQNARRPALVWRDAGPLRAGKVQDDDRSGARGRGHEGPITGSIRLALVDEDLRARHREISGACGAGLGRGDVVD